ncbi:hypothetical protein BYT27DRAFT_7219497 [Phlegmacium glaucopus]|nr:hypothetical protein BYT27DRAFT_7219497 [Phlegmacium glaucopus]
MQSWAGPLLGVEDLKVGGSDENMKGIDLGSARSAFEDETVVAVAEVMGAYAYGFGSSSSNGIEGWEKEFQPAGQDEDGLLTVSQSLDILQQMEKQVERDWISCPLASFTRRCLTSHLLSPNLAELQLLPKGVEYLKKTFYLALDILAQGDGDGSKAEAYVQQSSVDGKLSIPQLRLAYSALVRSATVMSTGAPGDTYTLAWYCVQLLIDTIRDLSPPLPYTSQFQKQGRGPRNF